MSQASVLALHGEAERFLAQSGRSSDPDVAVAALLAGKTEQAVARLEACTRREPLSEVCWNDLAAARIHLSEDKDDPQALARALVAADRALMLSPLQPAALFNRAIALQKMNLDRAAKSAWRRYLSVDFESQWAAEARSHLSSLPGMTSRMMWEESLPGLEAAVARGDQSAVENLVRRFPQESRTWGEVLFLSEWGESIQRGQFKDASRKLAVARQVSVSLHKSNGERLLKDAVAAIDSARPEWIPLLADAHVLYGRARVAYADRNVGAAHSLFERASALFRRARSPMFRITDYYIANCLSDQGRIEESLEAIAHQLSDLPPAYAALRAQLLWQRGTSGTRAGLFYESMESSSEALTLFDRLGERANAESMRAAVCLFKQMNGYAAESWRIRLAGFHQISRVGDPRVLQFALMGAARAEALDGNWDTALAFYTLTLERDLTAPNHVQSAEAAVWRALAAHRLEWNELAERALAGARGRLRGISEPTILANATNQLRLAEALIIRDERPRESLSLVDAAIDGAIDQFAIPEAYLERGHTWRRLQRDSEAIADYQTALRLLEERERTASTDELRDSYFRTGDAAAGALVDVFERRGEIQSAFNAVDRRRSRIFGLRSRERELDLSRLPAGTVLAHYTALPDRLIVFTATRGGLQVHRVPVSLSTLQQRIAVLTSAIAGDDERRTRTAGRDVYDLVIAPIEKTIGASDTLVIVADDVTAMVPFAALPRPDDRYLIEHITIVHTPAAAAYLHPLPARRRAPVSFAAVGNPAFDRRLFPQLDDLRAAETEVREIARNYPAAVTLTGKDATPERVVEAIGASAVVALACHAVLDARDPARSALLFSPSAGSSGALYVSQIARLPLRADVVVLTGCQTAATLPGTPSVLRGIASAFLVAGSRSVVGSLWNAEDEASREISSLFHRELAAGATPARALRAAQQRMLRSSDSRVRNPRSWGGFELHARGL